MSGPARLTPPLALHAWTLDSTPLAAVLDVARAAGFEGVELRWGDLERAHTQGLADDLPAAVRARGLSVACVSTKAGWMFADGAERDALVRLMDGCCRQAQALGCDLVMSPADFGRGPVAKAAARLREAADLAGQYGLRLALEPCSQAEQLDRLDPVREIVAAAGDPRCGLCLDTYHIERSRDWPTVERLASSEIFYVQYSDVPAQTRPGHVTDRLPPGHGTVPFREFFARLAAVGYDGALSYEAPNPAAWARDPLEVAREAVAATRGLLPR